MNFQEFRFSITGLTPLLMNNPDSMNEGNGGTVKPGKRKYEPAHEAQIREYRDENNHFVIPTIAFRNALLEACVGKKIGRLSAIRIISPALEITTEWVVLLDDAGQPITEYVIDNRWVVIQKKDRILRSRPRFDIWNAILKMAIDLEFADAETIKDLLNDAGRKIGVMDYRVTKKGWFGKFQAELM